MTPPAALVPAAPCSALRGKWSPAYGWHSSPELQVLLYALSATAVEEPALSLPNGPLSASSTMAPQAFLPRPDSLWAKPHSDFKPPSMMYWKPAPSPTRERAA